MKTRTAQGGTHLTFWCPACNNPHTIPVDGSRGWTWNGDRERPTIQPSIRVSGGGGYCCHAVVTAGRIAFQGDCTHALAGQTVDLIEWPTPEWGGLDPEG